MIDGSIDIFETKGEGESEGLGVGGNRALKICRANLAGEFLNSHHSLAHTLSKLVFFFAVQRRTEY